MSRIEARRRHVSALWLRFSNPCKAAAAIEPGDGAFDDPAFGFNDEAFGAISPFDDLDHQAADRAGNAILERSPRIGAVGEQLAQERELFEQGGQQQDTAVAILDIGGRHQQVQHQAQRVDEEMTLLALDQLAGIEAMPIDGRAPFSALLTLWLSMNRPSGWPHGSPVRGI
jgi:hypothetical protein